MYKDTTLELEIPLIVKNKEMYSSSHPEIGWCLKPLVLIAKTSHNAISPSACVHSDTMPHLIKRGWAQQVPQIPKEIIDKFQDELLDDRLVYKYDGNTTPVDSFRASLFGLPHIDDIETLGNISSNPSNNHTLENILSSKLLNDITPPYSTTTYRDLDMGITLQEYQDKHNVCHDGYDYFLKNSTHPTDKKFIIIQFNC
jgi:hypothetical protein